MGGANRGKHSCFFLCGEDCLREDIMSFPRRGDIFRVIYWVIIHGMGEVEEERVLLLSEEKTISIGGIFQRQHPLRFFPKDGETLSRVISYHIFFLLNW